jgi:hypothetical protein
MVAQRPENDGTIGMCRTVDVEVEENEVKMKLLIS